MEIFAMAKALKKIKPRKGHDLMDGDISFLDAVKAMNFELVKTHVAENPNCIRDVDIHQNNVMHICVLGGAAVRAREMMIFLITAPGVELLKRNLRTLNPLELAFALNDRDAIELLDDPTHAQLDARFPIKEERPHLTLVSSGKPPKLPGPGGS